MLGECTSLIIYNSTMSACEKAKRWKEAAMLLGNVTLAIHSLVKMQTNKPKWWFQICCIFMYFSMFGPLFTWGNDPIWLAQIFQMGWEKNHQRWVLQKSCDRSTARVMEMTLLEDFAADTRPRGCSESLTPIFLGGEFLTSHGTGTFIGVFLFMVRCRQIYRTSHGMGCRDPAEQILTLSILGCDHIQFIDECMCCSISMDFGSMYLLWTV